MVYMPGARTCMQSMEGIRGKTIKLGTTGSLQCGAIQDGQADSCRGMSEATAQSPSAYCAYNMLATLEAMVTDNTSPSSPDSHLRRCQQEYESVAAELSHGRDLCEEAAGTSGALLPQLQLSGIHRFVHLVLVFLTSMCMHSISCLDKAL